MAKMTVFERLVERAADQHGFIRAAQAQELSIDPAVLRQLAAIGRLEHRGWGLYRLVAIPITEQDEFHEAVLWANGRGVIAGESALALWNLADVNPMKIEIIVPPTYQPRRQGRDRYITRRRKLKVTDIDTVNNIPVLTPQVAIADAIKVGIAGGLVTQAIVNARARELIGSVTEARLRVQLADRGISKKSLRND